MGIKSSTVAHFELHPPSPKPKSSPLTTTSCWHKWRPPSYNHNWTDLHVAASHGKLRRIQEIMHKAGNYSCVFGKRNYRVLVRVSVCVCVCVCLCVCVFLHDNSKRNRSRNMKLEYIVVYENSSDEFDIELRRIKVKVTVGVQRFSPFTTIQVIAKDTNNISYTVRSGMVWEGTQAIA